MKTIQIRNSNIYVDSRIDNPVTGEKEFFFHYKDSRHGVYVSQENKTSEIKFNWYGQSEGSLMDAKHISRLMDEAVEFAENL